MAMMDKLNRHAELIGQMAHTVDADLGDALIRGQLDGMALRGAVLRCTTCEAAEVCAEWLTEHDGETGQAVPDFCVNRNLMERLRS